MQRYRPPRLQFTAEVTSPNLPSALPEVFLQSGAGAVVLSVAQPTTTRLVRNAKNKCKDQFIHDNLMVKKLT